VYGRCFCVRLVDDLRAPKQCESRTGKHCCGCILSLRAKALYHFIDGRPVGLEPRASRTVDRRHWQKRTCAQPASNQRPLAHDAGALPQGSGLSRSVCIGMYCRRTYTRDQNSIENPNALHGNQNSIETQTHLTGTKILSKRKKQHLLCSLLSYCNPLLRS
jgi:hypothetical protein